MRAAIGKGSDSGGCAQPRKDSDDQRRGSGRCWIRLSMTNGLQEGQQQWQQVGKGWRGSSVDGREKEEGSGSKRVEQRPRRDSDDRWVRQQREGVKEIGEGAVMKQRRQWGKGRR
ncbi:hypothetical protein BHM03_00049298 [Ensete ventricosum]|nr:hypothetical protein BHM03_00049298 [Ensete ventricosum]